MKSVSVTILLLVALSAASAQVASHAQSMAPGMAPAPAPTQTGSQAVMPEVTGKVVARVNGTTLTDQDLLREMFAIFPYARQHQGFPKLQEPAIHQGALEMIVFEELVYQEAERRKMTVSPEKLNRAVADFRGKFHSRDEYKMFLQVEAKGLPQVLRQEIRRSLLIEALLKVEVKNKSVVLPAEAKASYDKNPHSFEVADTFEIQTISIVPPKDPTADQLKDLRKRAEGTLRQAKAATTYEQFGLLAEKISEDDYRVDMGMHKPAGRDQLPPPVVQVLDKMKVGGVSDLIQLAQVYTIVRLNAHDAAGRSKFSAVRVSLTQSLQKRKANQLRSDLDKRLRKNAKVELL